MFLTEQFAKTFRSLAGFVLGMFLIIGFPAMVLLGAQQILREHSMFKRCEPKNDDVCIKQALEDIKKMKVFE